MFAQGFPAISAFNMAFLLAGLMALLSSFPAGATPNKDGGRYQRTLDILDAAYLPGPKEVLVVGHYGLVGLLRIKGDRATVEPLKNMPKMDFETVSRISDNVALIGGSTGQLFRYENGELTKVAELSEFNEPVLDISVQKNSIWAVGSRGLFAHSTNGKDWEKLEVSKITQPAMAFPSRQPGTFYLGVANIDPESFKFDARINGKRPVPDVDYTLFPDEGTLRINNPLDANAPATVSFSFSPGPPFGSGDVSWNLVLQENGRITLAGEFGLVIQSKDGGRSWLRRNGKITTSEPGQSYWLAGEAKGNRLVLAGAAGMIMLSDDNGDTWKRLPKPSKEGIFGVSFTDNATPVVAGAVGLLGTLEGANWALVDRTKLDLMSWVRTFVTLENGSTLLLGGRSTSLLYQNNLWKRLKLMIKEDRP
jgi:photosystem II stability/assembly factor-like uncharacterized protein